MAEKKYNIIIKGQQEVKTIEPLDIIQYPVVCNNKKEAEKIAAANYHDEYPDAEITTVAVKSSYLAPIIFLAISVFVSLFSWFGENYTIILKPGLFSVLIAIGLYSAVIIRVKGLKNVFNSASEILLTVMIILFCSTFLNLFTGDAKINLFFGLVSLEISGKYLLAAALILSWICMPAVSGVVWVLLFIYAALRIIAADSAMGIWGVIYLISAFIGIILTLKLQSETFIHNLGNEFISKSASVKHRIVSDVSAAGSAVKNTAGKIKTAVKTSREKKAAAEKKKPAETKAKTNTKTPAKKKKD